MPHRKHESFYSMASVSSYGTVIHSGAVDPFGYGTSRPNSSDESSFAMSSTVDDTFSFLKRDTGRKRVDSDASSFHCRGPGARRGHRRNESNYSVTSAAPPVSLYNRSFGAVRNNDPNSSISPNSNSFSSGGRPSWARHRQDASVASVESLFDFTGFDMIRPGIGDKMFERDLGMPLSSISGSPAGSTFSRACSSDDRMTCDSIMDADRRISVVDSLFEQAEHNRTSPDVSSDVFEVDGLHPEQERYLRANQFRPVSMISSSASEHTMSRDDDTMISVSPPQ